MKKNILTITNVKDRLERLRGMNVLIVVNKNRRKEEVFLGEVEDLYNSVFTFKVKENDEVKTFSYSEVLCGYVKFSKPKLASG